jgi:dTDP-4-amino-4,6-dideoxygalactose transaminase
MIDKLAIEGGQPVRPTWLPYGRQSVDAADVAAVAEALTGDWITQGPAVARFEEALAAVAGVRHVVAVANGTAALQVAYWAAELGPGDEVVTTPLTFAATANALVHQGVRPVFADVDPSTLNLSPDAVKRVITERTRAIVAVDFAGLPCDYEELAALAAASGVRLLADAAHSLGGAYRDRPVGALAEMTTFSFHPVKLITSGEGGAVATDRDDLAGRLRRVRHHGIRSGEGEQPWRYDIETPGHNARLTDFQSALGSSQLRKLGTFWTVRDRLARRYRERLAASPLVELPELPRDRRHGWHLFVILLRVSELRVDRDTVLRALRAENIGAQLHYPLVHTHSFYRRTFGYGPGLCPAAESVADRLVTLPLFPTMTEDDQDDVLRALDRVLTRYRR